MKYAVKTQEKKKNKIKEAHHQFSVSEKYKATN